VRSGSTSEQALETLRGFYSACSVDAWIYVFFSGLNTRDFENAVTYRERTIGAWLGEEDLISGRVMARREVGLSNNDIFIKTKARCPLQFGRRRSITPMLAYSHVLDPLS
jgi:hypothetical protein